VQAIEFVAAGRHGDCHRTRSAAGDSGPAGRVGDIAIFFENKTSLAPGNADLVAGLADLQSGAGANQRRHFGLRQGAIIDLHIIQKAVQVMPERIVRFAKIEALCGVPRPCP